MVPSTPGRSLEFDHAFGVERHHLGDGIALIDDFANDAVAPPFQNLAAGMTGTKGSGFSAFITSPRQTRLRGSGGWRGSSFTLMVLDALTMGAFLVGSVCRTSRSFPHIAVLMRATNYPYQLATLNGLNSTRAP
jgi:hypothetical protein